MMRVERDDLVEKGRVLALEMLDLREKRLTTYDGEKGEGEIGMGDK